MEDKEKKLKRPLITSLVFLVIIFIGFVSRISNPASLLWLVCGYFLMWPYIIISIIGAVRACRMKKWQLWGILEAVVSIAVMFLAVSYLPTV